MAIQSVRRKTSMNHWRLSTVTRKMRAKKAENARRTKRTREQRVRFRDDEDESVERFWFVLKNVVVVKMVSEKDTGDDHEEEIDEVEDGKPRLVSVVFFSNFYFNIWCDGENASGGEMGGGGDDDADDGDEDDGNPFPC